jgi:hypothetical protein
MSNKRPRIGQNIYVPSSRFNAAGLATVNIIIGEKVCVREAPGATFDWQMLCANQVDLVDKHAGGKAVPLPH